MKGRKPFFFLSVFWLLAICTILSNSIERQTTVKVQVFEPPITTSESELDVETYSEEILSSGDLYEAVNGSEWEVGLRAKIVPPEFYITDENQILLAPNTGGMPILYRTKELFPGAVVQKTTPRQGREGFYLTLSPKKEPQLFSMTGKEPYMENLHKEELGLLPEERLFNMTEVEEFSKTFPLLGLLFVLLVSTLLILFCNWKLAGNVKKNRMPLMANSGVLMLLLFGIYKIANTIYFPSSLLPKENILDFGHYGKIFGQILGALEQLQQSGNADAGKILGCFRQNMLLGCLAVIFGILAWCVFLIVDRKRRSYQSSLR